MRPVLPPSEQRRLTRSAQKGMSLERRYLASSGAAPRLVYGCVYNDGGTDDPGSGDWEVSWDSANRYTFTVTPAFTAAFRNVLLTATNNISASGIVPSAYFVVFDTTTATTTGFDVYTYDAIGDPADGGFAFLAVDDLA